jgi:hypothetical protein
VVVVVSNNRIASLSDTLRVFCQLSLHGYGSTPEPQNRDIKMDVQASFRHPHRHSSTSCLAFSFAVMETVRSSFHHLICPISLQIFFSISLPARLEGLTSTSRGEPSQVLRCLLESSALKARVRGYMLGFVMSFIERKRFCVV